MPPMTLWQNIMLGFQLLKGVQCILLGLFPSKFVSLPIQVVVGWRTIQTNMKNRHCSLLH